MPFAIMAISQLLVFFKKSTRKCHMDLREKKTKRNIKNAFIELRAKKPLERISVKELAELAEISKATFYLHYRDIYDLSDCLQKEIIQNILNSVSNPDLLLSDESQFVQKLFHAFHSHQAMIDILFSGSQTAVLPNSIEKELREYIFKQLPEFRDNAAFNIMLSYKIQGGYHAYMENSKNFDIDTILETTISVNNRISLLNWNN